MEWLCADLSVWRHGADHPIWYPENKGQEDENKVYIEVVIHFEAYSFEGSRDAVWKI